METPNGWHDSRIKLTSGRQLGYAECGDPLGVPVFYFHGGFSSRLDILFASQICKDQGVRLIAPDRPGIGLSERLPNRTLLDWPKDVVELMDHLKIEKAYALGWSAGGPHAMACAYAMSDRLMRTATSGCVSPLTWPGSIDSLGLQVDRLLVHSCHIAPSLVPILLKLSKLIPVAELKKSFIKEAASRSDKEVVEAMSLEEAKELFLEALRPGVDGTADDYRAIAFPWGFELEEIKTPLHMWQGADDNLVPVSHADYLSERLPHAKTFRMPDTGHFLLHKHISEVLRNLVG